MKNREFKVKFFLLYVLLSSFSYSQNYQWQWAIGGGGIEDLYQNRDYLEQINDSSVDSHNNYYFLANISERSSQFNGIPVNVNGDLFQDIFLFSTNCNGTVRWSKAIGGLGIDEANEMVLDENDNIYISAHPRGVIAPVYFSPTDSLPGPPDNPDEISDFYKTAFIVKYDSIGNFQWKKSVQGPVNNSNTVAFIHGLEIDSKGKLHFIAGLSNGLHLDGLANVPSTFGDSTYQYYAVVLNPLTQIFEKAVLLSFEGELSRHYTKFRYDEKNDRYYISSYKNIKKPLSYNGRPMINPSFVIALNANDGSEIWRREIESQLVNDDKIYDVETDTMGDVYITGRIWNAYSNIPEIIAPYDSNFVPYQMGSNIYGYKPFIVKFSSDGNVLWYNRTNGHTSTHGNWKEQYGYKIAFRGNEVALSCIGSNAIWDGFSMSKSKSDEARPLLVRFNKQNGKVIGLHDISTISASTALTSVIADNDGNYVVGGSIYGDLFDDGINGIIPYKSSYSHDFFIAKLSASICGTTVSTNKIKDLEAALFPNPTTGMVSIQTSEKLEGYEVYNISGQLLQSGKFDRLYEVNLQRFEQGTYIIKIKTLNGSETRVKVIKK